MQTSQPKAQTPNHLLCGALKLHAAIPLPYHPRVRYQTTRDILIPQLANFKPAYSAASPSMETTIKALVHDFPLPLHPDPCGPV